MEEKKGGAKKDTHANVSKGESFTDFPFPNRIKPSCTPQVSSMPMNVPSNVTD